MEVAKTVVEVIGFLCDAECWRMAALWTLSLLVSYLRLFYQGSSSPKPNSYPRCSPKNSVLAVSRPVCIVTGATSGLGAAAAYALSKEGFHVVLVLEFKHSLLQWLRDSNMHLSVQLLINNAGILATSCRVTSEGYDQMLATNYIGAFCLTKVLLPLLENSTVPSRVVNVTSFTHRNVRCRQADRETVSGKLFIKLKDYPFAHIYEYSKLCMLLFSYELHRRVRLINKSQHLSVVAADPGAVKTNIMREIPSPVSTMAFTAMKLLGVLQSSETGVSSIVDAALAPPEVSGVYFFGGKGRSLNSSTLSYDAKLAKDLWDTSCDLLEELQLAFRGDELAVSEHDTLSFQETVS